MIEHLKQRYIPTSMNCPSYKFYTMRTFDIAFSQQFGLHKSEISSSTHRVSTSTIASFFSHRCERFLLVKSRESTKERDGAAEPSAVFQAHVERGKLFEQQLCELLREDAETDFHEMEFDPGDSDETLNDATLERLVNVDLREVETSTAVIAQMPMRLQQTEVFWLKQLSKAGVSFGTAIPDFVFFEETPESVEITIVDSKSSSNVKITHQVQVSMYQLVLEVWMRAHQVNEKRKALGRKKLKVRDVGGIWTPARKTLLDLSKFREKVQHFLEYELPSTFAKSPETIFWKLGAHCKDCSNLEHCRTLPDGRALVGHLNFLDEVVDIEDCFYMQPPESLNLILDDVQMQSVHVAKEVLEAKRPPQIHRRKDEGHALVAYPREETVILMLWAEPDQLHVLATAKEAEFIAIERDGSRILERGSTKGTGFLMKLWNLLQRLQDNSDRVSIFFPDNATRMFGCSSS